MNGAIVISWGTPVRGRELKSLEVFSSALAYYDQLAKQGRVHGHREYFSVTGRSGGWMIVEGQLDELTKIQVEDTSLRLQSKAAQIVENFQVQLFTGGTEGSIQESIVRYTESLTELGYLNT